MVLKSKIKNKINGLIRRGRWYNETLLGGASKFRSFNKYNLDVVNLGSTSSLYAFDYSTLSINGFNWALSSQYLLADYEILRNYSTFLKERATVILCACLFSLDGYDITYFDDRYYTFLYPSSIFQYSVQRKDKVQDMIKNPVKYYPLLSFFSFIKGLFKKQGTPQLSDLQYEEDARRWMIDVWAKQFSIDDFEAPPSLRNKDLIEQSLDIVNNIKSFCLEKGFNFVIVLPPVSMELRKWLTPHVRDNYVYALKNSNLLKGVKFLDYLDDPQFEGHMFFQNAYIMNSFGAKAFTKRVLSDLNII